MKATLIDWGLALFGLKGKLAGHHTKMGLAADALLIVSALILAIVKSLIVAQTGEYGTAIALFIDSPELKAIPLLWTAGKVVGGVALKQDKAIAVSIAIEDEKPEIAKLVAAGEIAPLAVIPPPADKGG